MAQKRLAEKLHAACDECRTRKLKCSGERPICGRCTREQIECIYSLQKPMGRPRKRRRGCEADVPSEQAASAQMGYDSNTNGSAAPASFSSFDFFSPLEFADLSSTNEAYTQAQLDPGLIGTYGPSPPITNNDLGLTPPVDPSLWDTQFTTSDIHAGHQQATQDIPTDQIATGPCACLSLAYLTITDLQNVSIFSFPQVVVPLRKVMTTVSSLIHCPICPSDPFSAIQNVSSIVSLFKAIVERFSKVLNEVDLEAARMISSGKKKPYRIGDNNPALSHLHTGTPDCPVGFNIELEPDIWKKLVKTALRTEIDGGGSNPRPLKQLLKETEERQQRWHDKSMFSGQGKSLWGQGHCEKDKATCESLGSEHIRRVIGMLNWD